MWSFQRVMLRGIICLNYRSWIRRISHVNLLLFLQCPLWFTGARSWTRKFRNTDITITISNKISQLKEILKPWITIRFRTNGHLSHDGYKEKERPVLPALYFYYWKFLSDLDIGWWWYNVTTGVSCVTRWVYKLY